MKILSKHFGEISLNQKLLPNGKSLKSHTYTTSNPSGKYVLFNRQSKNFSAWFVELQSLKQNDKITFLFPSPDISLHISLLHTLVTPVSRDEKLFLHENSFLLFYSPLSFAQIETTRETKYCFFELFITKSHLRRSKKRYKGMSNFLKSIDQKTLVRYYHYPLVIDFDELQIIEQIKIATSETKFNKCCQTILSDCLNITAKNKNKTPQRISLNEANKIYKVREFIDTHITDKHLSIQFISEETNITEYVIKHGFKKLYRTTPHQYIIVSRLNKSLELLRETNKTIIDISNYLGFDHTQTFNRLFLQFFKISPSTYKTLSKSV